MSPRQKRYTRFVAGGAALIGLAVALWLVAGRAAASGTGDWAEVRRDDLVVGVPVAGTLSSVQSVRLGPPQIAQIWDFKIAFMAPEGIQVKPGQPVLGFDTSELERQLLDKKAERDSAQKELEKKQTDLEIARRDQELELAEAEARFRKASLKVDVPSDLVAAKELANARADLDLARREVAYLKGHLRLAASQGGTEAEALARKRDRAAVRVKEMEDAIARMTVTAPREGTLVYIANDEGEKKKVGDSVWRGQSVIEIPDLGHLAAEGEVDEADAGRVAVGQRVSFRLDAHPDDVFTGTVRAIGGSVRAKSEVNPLKVVRLSLDIDRTDPQRMRPGMRFLGTVEVERVAKALVAPVEAVFNRPDGPVVYRKTGWRSEEVRPVLGLRNDRQVEIRSGLKPGDLVSRRDLSDAAGGEG
jgi:HlyD family secretion protein